MKKGTEAAALIHVPDSFNKKSLDLTENPGDGSLGPVIDPGDNPTEPPAEDPADNRTTEPRQPPVSERIIFSCATAEDPQSSKAGEVTVRLIEVNGETPTVVEESATNIEGCGILVVQIAKLFPGNTHRVAVEMVNQERTVSYLGITDPFAVQTGQVTALDLRMTRTDLDPTGAAAIRVLFDEPVPPEDPDEVCEVQGPLAGDFRSYFFRLPLVAEMTDNASDPNYVILNQTFGFFRKDYLVAGRSGNEPLAEAVYLRLRQINDEFCNKRLSIPPFLRTPGDYFGAKAVACSKDLSACKFLISDGASEQPADSVQ